MASYHFPEQPSGTDNSSEILVIDSRVSAYQSLLDKVSPDIDVLILRDGDSLESLGEYLQGRQDVQAIHILSHGSEGAVYLGDTVLSSQTLGEHQTLLAQIQAAMAPDGDLLFYGCNVAKGEGKSFLYDLARLTQTDVAASDDVTGRTGDWELEISTGLVDTPLAFGSEVLDAYAADLATFDFEGGAGTAPYTETEGTVTMSVSAVGGIIVTSLGGVGGTSGNYMATAAAGTVTVSFDAPVDITTMVVANTHLDAKTIRITPNTGSYVDSNSLVNDSGETVTVNFSGITSFTLTSTSGTYEGILDTIVFTAASTDPTITSATYDAGTGALVVTGTNFTPSAGDDVIANKLTFTGEGGPDLHPDQYVQWGDYQWHPVHPYLKR